MASKLWSKNFTIITVGTIISMLGSAVANFSIGLLILEKTDSTFLYSLYFALVMIPNVVVPILAGPILDRIPRKQVIVGLDFLQGFIFLLISCYLMLDTFNYTLFVIVGMVVQTISSVYHVAYEAFYPELITEGNFSKAYSISSMIWPICNSLMVPVAAFVLEIAGFVPLFVFNAVSYLLAAILEMFIKHEENHVVKDKSIKFRFVDDLKEGITYVRQEKGLLNVMAYFTITMAAFGVVGVLQLPFFKSVPSLGVTKYSFVVSISTLGRFFGGMVHYFYNYPAQRKFQIAICVYVLISFIDILFYRVDYWLMIILMFASGVLSVTSFTIRTSATQSYIPNNKRARFNAIFMMSTTIGSIIGQLVAGVLGEFIPIPTIILWVMSINLIGVYFFIYRPRAHVKALYNRSV